MNTSVTKSCIVSLITIVLFVSILQLPVSATQSTQAVTGNWMSYTTEVVPENGVYSVSSAEEFAWIMKNGNENKHYYSGETVQLLSNIDLSGHAWTSIENFYGLFEGNGFTVSGLYINTQTNEQALFDIIGENAILQNLTVSGSVTGDNYVAGVCAFNYGTIQNIISDVDVTGKSNVAGIVFSNSKNAILQNVINTGSVTSTEEGSGAGIAKTNAGWLYNCINTAKVSGKFIGGVVEYNLDGTIKNSVNIGELIGDTARYIGGIVRNNDGSVENSYWKSSASYGGISDLTANSVLTECASFDNAQGALSAEVFVEATGYTNLLGALNAGVKEYNTQNPTQAQWKQWKIFAGEYDNYPVVAMITYWIDNIEAVSYSGNHVYYISKPEQLAWVMQQVRSGANDFENETVVLSNDISLAGHRWTPIGSLYSSYFAGTFDGEYHTISGLNVYEPSENFQALFHAVATKGVVKNFTVSGSVTGLDKVAAVACLNHGVIQNVVSEVNVASEKEGAGIAFENRNTVLNTLNLGSVTCNGAAAGLVVDNYSNIHNSANAGSINGSELGGIVHTNFSGSLQSGSIKNVQNLGALQATIAAGGLAYVNNATIQNSYWLNELSEQAINSGNEGVQCASFSSLTSNITPAITLVGGDDTEYTDLDFALNRAIELQNNLNPDDMRWYAWHRSDNDAFYPIFIDSWINHTTPITPVDGVYTVTNAQELAWVMAQVNLYNITFLNERIELKNNIDLRDHNWMSIGEGAISTKDAFSGVFDGMGNTISGLNMEDGLYPDQAMFYRTYKNSILQDFTVTGSITADDIGAGVAYINEGVIKNVVSDINIIATSASGITFESEGTIINVTNHGDITASGNASGVVGNLQSSGILINAENTGNIEGTNCGGVTRSNYGMIVNAINRGDVTAEIIAGGITYNNTVDGEIYNSINYGVVEGQLSGGITGENYGEITNVVNYGNIVATYTHNSGALIGRSKYQSSLTNGYWSETSGLNAVGMHIANTVSQSSAFKADGTLISGVAIDGVVYDTILPALNATSDKLRGQSPIVPAWPWLTGIDKLPMFDPNPLPGSYDLNQNGIVDTGDLVIVANSANYNKKVGESGVNSNADINADGTVNFEDLVILRNINNLGKTCR